MFCGGNPVSFVDVGGHWPSFSGFKKMVSSVVSKAGSSSTYSITLNKNHLRGLAYGIAGAVLGAATGAVAGAAIGAMAGLATGGIPGMIAGAAGGLVIGAAIGGAIGGLNGALGGYYDIYSHDKIGLNAFVGDSTYNILNTAAGLGMMGYGTLTGGQISGKYSRHHNSFVMTGFKHPANLFGQDYSGISVGNFSGIKYSEEDLNDDQLRDNEAWKCLRHELIHTQQYRQGGVIPILKIFL